ncbi:MAG: GtrA family protein [Hyphomicrobiaceae bacterium]
MASIGPQTVRPARNGPGAGDSVLGWLARFASEPGRALEFARYAGASGVALAIDTGLFLVLIAISECPATLAATIGYLTGVAVHYVLSVRYIFAAERTGKSHRRLIAEFLATGLLGLLLTVIVIRLTVDVGGLPPLLGKIVSSGTAFLAVYVARAGGVLAPSDDARAASPPEAKHSRAP